MSIPFQSLLQSAVARPDNRGDLKVLYESSATVLKRSFSHKGVFRGMHIQVAPQVQTKIIRVISGKIVDFALQPEKKILHWKVVDPATDWFLVGPEYAHGFYAVEDTVFEYLCDGGFAEKFERSYSIVDLVKRITGADSLIQSQRDLQAEVLDTSDFVCQPPIAASVRVHA